LKDRWQASERPVSALNYLLGDQAIVIGNTEGSVEVWFPVRTPANLLKFRKIHTFESHPAAVTQVYSSPRNRNFLTIDAGGSARLHYSTTGKTQLKFKPADYPVYAGSFAPKSDGILVIDSHRQFSLYHLNNPHPETTFKTLSGKVWYEGYPEPEFVWQSTGGSDEFESKLSLIPLIFGTLKGTLYAMLFSLPIAILAAIYVSQFVPAWLSRSIKPTVEIMAALPSVVIGFLAGLYFSPLFEKYLVSTFVFIAFLPVIFIISVFLWRSVPEEKRVRMPRGWEVLYTLPILVVTLVLALIMGKPFENLLFDGNFQQWLYATWNITYETRNSFVVGFALGFAVIPIIFTVAEDALANVPESLRSASLALGASRWQTVRRVVIPAASGGIFAATMLGLGRAVGETMIVLMATGNTPILDLSPFNGFRAMSACIAVEIPEAPVGGTLYRVLFLTALLLFLFTFVLNTLSSMIGERLRKKYARF
jgi:phosphate transport system permease protein